MTNKHKIINNFLPTENFIKFKNLLLSEDFPWFYKENMTNNDECFFNHCFYNYNQPTSSFYFEYIFPILKELNCASILQVRANLLLKKEKQYFSEFHTDYALKCKTSIFYINTSNGYTILDEELKIKIKCEENKMLIFDSNISHCAVSQTDVKKRIVINFNYFEKNESK
jgi:hypothetical protein